VPPPSTFKTNCDAGYSHVNTLMITICDANPQAGLGILLIEVASPARRGSDLGPSRWRVRPHEEAILALRGGEFGPTKRRSWPFEVAKKSPHG